LDDDKYKILPFASANGINSAQSACFGAVFGAKQPKNCDKTFDNPEVLKSNLMGAEARSEWESFCPSAEADGNK